MIQEGIRGQKELFLGELLKEATRVYLHGKTGGQLKVYLRITPTLRQNVGEVRTPPHTCFIFQEAIPGNSNPSKSYKDWCASFSLRMAVLAPGVRLLVWK